MLTIKKYFQRLSLLSGLLLTLSIGVKAQRGGHSSGGGGSHFSGGGGHSFSGGGGNHSFNNGASRSASFRGTNNGGGRSVVASRPSGITSRPGSYARPSSYNRSYASRPGIGVRARYVSRPGYGGDYGYRAYHGYGFRGGYYYGFHGGLFYGPYGYYPFWPYFGFRLGFLPFGYSTFYWGSNPYYYYNGIYYQSYGSEYQVVQPPLGATVTQLPAGATSTVIDGQVYYQYHGTFYRENVSAENQLSYTVVGVNGVVSTGSQDNAQVQPQQQQAQPQDGQSAHGDYPSAPASQYKAGDKLDMLPDDTKPVVINQQKFYVDASGNYFQEQVDGNKVTYIVVGQGSPDGQ